jgi:hypothetical protein
MEPPEIENPGVVTPDSAALKLCGPPGSQRTSFTSRVAGISRRTQVLSARIFSAHGNASI